MAKSDGSCCARWVAAQRTSTHCILQYQRALHVKQRKPVAHPADRYVLVAKIQTQKAWPATTTRRRYSRKTAPRSLQRCAMASPAPMLSPASRARGVSGTKTPLKSPLGRTCANDDAAEKERAAKSRAANELRRRCVSARARRARERKEPPAPTSKPELQRALTPPARRAAWTATARTSRRLAAQARNLRAPRRPR